MLKCDVILDIILDSARQKSAEEESICPCLLGVCDLFEVKLENVKEVVW